MRSRGVDVFTSGSDTHSSFHLIALKNFFFFPPDHSETMGRGNSDESRELLHKYNLCFDGLVEPSDWPAAHKTLFQDVQRLGAYKYSDYERTRKERSPHEPWGSDILKRADRVRSIARKCSKEAQNEAGWRLSLEAEIFARFTVEVAWYALHD